MRRMRDLYWGYLIVVLPVLAAALGIHHMIADRGDRIKSDSSVLKPSAMLPKSGESIRERMVQEEVLAEANRDDYDAYHEEVSADPGREDVATKDSKPATRFLAQSVVDQESAKLYEAFEKTQPKECRRVEYAGPGPSVGEPSSQDWAAVMNEFWAVKGKLLAWVQKNREQLGVQVANALEQNVKALRVERPPTPAEPDLSWRGIGVLSADTQGSILRLGGGFLRLLQENPTRARFELTRLVAQTWAPCHLQAVAKADTLWDPVLNTVWDPLLKCLGVEAEGCSAGTYSESGWAISTAMAVSLSGTGCTVPALADESRAGCLKSMPFPRSASNNSTVKVASR